MELSSKKCGRCVVAASFVLFGGLAFGEVVFVNAAEWWETGTGLTASGWEVNNLTKYAKFGGAKFYTKQDAAVSPVFAHSITQVVANIVSGQEETLRFMTVTPTVGEGAAKRASIALEYKPQTFVWSAAEGVRQIKFSNEGSGSAYWGVRDVTIWTDRIEAPTGLAEDPKWRDAFHAHWQAEPLGVSHEIEVCRVEWTPPQGEWLHSWNFSSLTNTSGNTRGFDALERPESLNDVTGENLCLQGHAGGHLQVGKSETAGVMVLPVDEGGVNRTGLLRLFKHTSDGGTEVSLAWVDASGQENAWATVAVTDVPREFRLDLPDGAAAIRIASTNSRRVRVESVSVVSDYAPGFATTNLVVRHRGVNCDRLVRSLSPGEWVWRARSFDAEGADSPWSGWRAVTLRADDPARKVPGFRLLLR